MVILSDDEDFVKSEFGLSNFIWSDDMKLVLGEEFPIVAIGDHKTVVLPSPDGRQHGIWYFPKSVITQASGRKLYINLESAPDS